MVRTGSIVWGEVIFGVRLLSKNFINNEASFPRRHGVYYVPLYESYDYLLMFLAKVEGKNSMKWINVWYSEYVLGFTRTYFFEYLAFALFIFMFG